MTATASRAMRRGSIILLAVFFAALPLWTAAYPAQAQSLFPDFSNGSAPVPPAAIPNIEPTPPLPIEPAPNPNAVVAPPAVTRPQPPVTAAPTQIPQLTPGLGGQVALYLTARFAKDMPVITNGLQWRIYADKPDATGAFPLIKEEKTAAPAFLLPPGSYVVHASFGRASIAKQVKLSSETVRAVFEISAGGIRIEGRVGDVRIPASQISFDIYKGSQFEAGDKRALAQNVATGDVVLVPEGTYMIVSNYGDGNSVIRSDIRVQTGKLTDVTVTHRAAVITLKLVSKDGGDALANTAWSVLTPGGDVIKESIGAFPRVILAEGDYRAIARNDGKVFERQFKVVTGVDSEIAVVAR